MSSHDGTLGLLGRVGSGAGGSAERAAESGGVDAALRPLSLDSVATDAAGTAGFRPPRGDRDERRAAPVAGRESVPASGNGEAASFSAAAGRIARGAGAPGEPG